MTRPHAEVERERRLVLAVIGATGSQGITARAIQEAVGITMAAVRNRLRELEQDGLVLRRGVKQRVGGKWWTLWVRVTS